MLIRDEALLSSFPVSFVSFPVTFRRSLLSSHFSLWRFFALFPLFDFLSSFPISRVISFLHTR